MVDQTDSKKYMEISATGKYIRVSQRKLQLLADSVKHMRPNDAVSALSFIRKSGSEPLKKLIASAIDNAVKRYSINSANLKIAGINVLKGPPMKRFRAVSRGMAHTYKKKMCHIKVTLIEVKSEVKPKINLEVKPSVKTVKTLKPKS
ncbi:MAG: 50S ribosomal protein L22 [Candidatus Gottesmanbacteria bacterium GW2011_GWA1_34_13]|uniref:50S ribosomal protein L22 n=1 Tax=Candidatus Gottesmanbacteria bacterium GW2011_GWA1_34_13 TaxID=1618434 RepID=A0A0G0ARZ7_9BACT|nr:MAG: 50S ribosomal protein L22 [Candidatus Gottesmanbacteria bacterium GW2011_GWA1_34_13]